MALDALDSEKGIGMAKGQKKSNKEARKPKADKNKPSKGLAKPAGLGSSD